MQRIVAISGPDGSGKSSAARALVARLNLTGFESKYVWFRHRHFLSKPVLGLGRLLGFSYYVDTSEGPVGVHRYHECRPLAVALAATGTLDLLVAAWWGTLFVRRRNGPVVVVYDRWVLDALVDLQSSTGLPLTARTIIERYSSWLQRRSGLSILVDRELPCLLGCRPDYDVDPRARDRFFLYRSIQERSGFHTVSNSGTIEELVDSMMQIVGDP